MSKDVDTIGDEAFSRCENLEDIDVPNTATQISDSAFDSSTAVRRSRIPESIEVISGPTKTTYKMDEDFDCSGMKIKVTYSDGTTEQVTDGFGAWLNSRSAVGSTATVMYGNCTAELDGINISNESCDYTVFYTDEYGNKIAESTKGKSAGPVVNLTAPDIDGYIPYEDSIEHTIGYDNRITFVYRPDTGTDISDATVKTVSPAEYTGNQIKPSVEVLLDGKKLSPGTDYIVYYGANLTEDGYIVIEGAGEYSGVVIADFTIVKKDTQNASDSSVASAAQQAAAEEAARQGIFNAKLPKVTASKPAAAKKAITVKWKKLSKKNQKKAGRIEVWVCPNKKFGAADTVMKQVSKRKASVKIKRLGKKKTYYVKVRTIKYVGGVKQDGKWSKVKKAKTK